MTNRRFASSSGGQSRGGTDSVRSSLSSTLLAARLTLAWGYSLLQTKPPPSNQELLGVDDAIAFENLDKCAGHVFGHRGAHA